MKTLNLKPTHKAVATYYAELQQLSLLNAKKEGAVSPAFANLLRVCAGQFDWTLYEQYPLKHGAKNIYPDGALVDAFNLPYGYWEAKDSHDDLAKEVRKKFDAGYPKDNILFQAPDRAILWQDGKLRLDNDISQPDALIDALKTFFEYQPPQYEQWQQAVDAFKDEVPKIGAGLLTLIAQERAANKAFSKAFEAFMQVCRDAINPNIATQAVEEMLIQHLLTERIFSKVFDHPDFRDMNIIAREIEGVIRALVFPHGGRNQFFKPLDRFYHAIESTAATISDYSQKQAFLNTVYEKFFQGFSVKVADTHGIVYTPQPVVQFMVNSVEEMLKREFDASLSDEGVHILDPFVGTGNFLIRVMQTLRKTALPDKYANELHCNEVMLLPYYIASMNIEHEYMTLTGDYKPFEGICLVDTFQLAEARQLGLFSEANTARVADQKKQSIFVIIGNPPYNAGQVNENDNNKNRKYPTLDKQVAETYAKSSAATNKNALSDPYIKAFRWASDRIGDEGIVAFVSNNKFLKGIAFDGMRKELAQDFDALYLLDLGGDVRENPKLSGTTHNVFGIQVGVSINLLVKRNTSQVSKTCEVWYARVDEYWRKEQKFAFLEEKRDYSRIEWQAITPDSKQTWLTEGLRDEFETFLPMGSKETKSDEKADVEAIFKNYGRGVATSRDTWAYNFQHNALAENMRRMIETYNEHVSKFSRLSPKPEIDAFVANDDTKISWSRDLKLDLKRGHFGEFNAAKIRKSLYRPFTQECLFFDRILNEEVYQFPHIFPTPETEAENRVICLSGLGSSKPFHTLITNIIPCLDLLEKTQCFPFYTYDEDGTNRRENITDWALAQFRAQYDDVRATGGDNGVGATGRSPLQKWDIFYYVYALLHHPQYRETYAANLKRELPRIPFVGANCTGDRPVARTDIFWQFADAGRKLAELHINYEQQPKYKLTFLENDKEALDWRVEKMKLSADHTQIVYNRFLTLAGIPPEAFDYKLGNKSALHWLIDQYQVSTDKRSGIVNDPNRADDPQYIVNLIRRVITVSVETMKIIKALPTW